MSNISADYWYYGITTSDIFVQCMIARESLLCAAITNILGMDGMLLSND